MDIEAEIRSVASAYANRLKKKIDKRVAEMADDDKSHFLIYQVLGVTDDEGKAIDIYQNKGRFLYRYAGSFLEEAAKICLISRFPDAASLRIPNTRSNRPKTFEIDCVIDTDAIEIKWRDATTDGDHIMKENTRIHTIQEAGFTPVRVMFYYPNRVQAIRIQSTLETLYKGVGGHYYFGEAAWSYIRDRSHVDLKAILEELARENTA